MFATPGWVARIVCSAPSGEALCVAAGWPGQRLESCDALSDRVKKRIKPERVQEAPLQEQAFVLFWPSFLWGRPRKCLSFAAIRQSLRPPQSSARTG